MQALKEQKFVYSSSLSGKAGLLEETRQVLQHLAMGQTLDEVRRLVLDANLFGKQSHHTRQATWDAVRLRLSGIGDMQRIHRLGQIISSASLTRQSQNLILFYELCRSQPLLADMTTDCLYPLYLSGRSVIDKGDVIKWLAATTASHPEIDTWSPQTREKIASNFLSLVRDFGLVTGTVQKRLAHLYVPLYTFIYIVYDLVAQGLSARAIIDSSSFHLVLIDRDDLFLMLADATKAGYLTFRQAGTIYDLTLQYRDIDEVLQHVAGEIPRT